MVYTWGSAGSTGHGGSYLTNDCTIPVLLLVQEGRARIHSLDFGFQHGALVLTPAAQQASLYYERPTKRAKYPLDDRSGL